MKVINYFIMGLGSIFVVFMLLTFFYDIGSNYGYSESDNIGNISTSDFQESIESAEDTANTLQEVFESESIVVTTYNLIVKGIPSVAKTIFRGSIDSIKLVLIGSKKVFGARAFTISLGLLIAALVVILIITNWDWIRSIKPGS